MLFAVYETSASGWKWPITSEVLFYCFKLNCCIMCILCDLFLKAMNSPEHGEVSDEAMLEKGNFCNLYTVHLQQLKLQLKLKKCHQA